MRPLPSRNYEALEERDVKYAIRLPANDNLQRNVRELLTRPVGRPSYKPVVRYKSFLYQAASWKQARRVVAKVEFHCGELFPRVGFIVTNLGLQARRWCGSTTSVGQPSSGSKKVSRQSRLSCHRFRANEVGLWLSLIAHNLRNLWRRLALPADREVVANQLAAAVDENRRTFDQACTLPLVAPGGEPSDAAAVCRHAEEGYGAAAAGGIGRAQREANLDEDAGA